MKRTLTLLCLLLTCNASAIYCSGQGVDAKFESYVTKACDATWKSVKNDYNVISSPVVKNTHAIFDASDEYQPIMIYAVNMERAKPKITYNSDIAGDGISIKDFYNLLTFVNTFPYAFRQQAVDSTDRARFESARKSYRSAIVLVYESKKQAIIFQNKVATFVDEYGNESPIGKTNGMSIGFTEKCTRKNMQGVTLTTARAKAGKLLGIPCN